MSFAKLRPAGSKVPLPAPDSRAKPAPWADHYNLYTVNSGTAALSLAVKLSVNQKGSKRPEVIVPAYGCPDLIAAVVAQGARPVLVDLVMNRPWMCLDAVKQALTAHTVAIVAVGFLGIPDRLNELSRVAKSVGALLIEDSAQVFPPCSSGTGVADLVVLSFGRGKPINLLGGGGLLIRKDRALDFATELNALPLSKAKSGLIWHLRRGIVNLLLQRLVYGLIERLPFLGIGVTKYQPLTDIYRVILVRGGLQAGIEAYYHRREICARYAQALSGLTSKGWTLLPSACFEELSQEKACPCPSVILRYPLLAPSRELRDLALARLNRQGIGASKFYGSALPFIDGIDRILSTSDWESSRANLFADCLITLPAHEDVKNTDVALIASVLLN